MTQPLPKGFSLATDFISVDEEADLLQLIRNLPFGQIRMHGVTAKRRVVQFGWHYSFESFRLTPAPPAPPEFDSIRQRAAANAKIDAEGFAETLVTEYSPGASIGWHRDAPPFGIIAGISLGAPCRMRFRGMPEQERVTTAVQLPPRSIYLLTGPARKDWQHSISAVREYRYSITFRTLRGPTNQRNR